MNNNIKSTGQIGYVNCFEELISTSFNGDVNAICWDRKLIGDFSEIIKKVTLNESVVELSKEDLLELELTKEGSLARQILLNDLELLTKHGASPVLNIIKFYESDDSFPFFPTDVYSFHVDRSPIATDTFLCTYYGQTSDIIPNAEARQKIHIPEIRKELKKLHQDEEEDFKTFLSDNFFDLHYQMNLDSTPTSLKIGHLCKIAIDHPGSNVLPCIHRAPKENGQYRLLMIC